MEDNYKGKAKINWNYPYKHPIAKSIENYVDDIISDSPDIIFVSLYVWNNGLSQKIMEALKRKLPSCFIVVGGPHLLYKKEPLFFETHWYIDFLCQSDGYGEPFINEFLFQLETDKKWDEVPYLVRPSEDKKTQIKSPKKFDKRSFVWPKNIYKRNADYLFHLKKRKEENNKQFYFHYESSRGCPFGCTYCEWGGGINSKVNFKPSEDIFEDLHFIYENIKPEFFTFTDANFGIIDRDVDIAKRICEYHDTIGVPTNINIYGPTKVRKENIYKIEDMFAERKMNFQMKIPVQDTNMIVNENIKRTDDSWKSQLEAYKKIQKKHGTGIALEMILGLPGATIDSYYEGHEEGQDEGISSFRYLWHFLPTAPAANDSYIKKHKIETIKVNSESVFNASFVFYGIVEKGQKNGFDGEYNLMLDDRYKEPSDIVVSTYSYTRDEWLEMWMMDAFISVLEDKGYLKHISKYLRKEKSVSFSDFYKSFWKTFLFSDEYLNKKQNLIKNKLISDTKERAYNKETIEDFYFYDMPKEIDLGLRINMTSAIIMMININRSDFFSGIKKWIEYEFVQDDALNDLIKWSANNILWIDYTPNNPSTFYSEYDWVEWINTGLVNKKKTKHTPKDTKYANDLREIEWGEYDMKTRIEKFFFVLCSDYSSPSHTFKNIEVEYE